MLAASAVAAALLLTACGPGGGGTTAASVNGEVIPITELEARFEVLEGNPQFAQQLEDDTDGQFVREVQAQILSGLIEARIVAQGADELGISIEEADVAARREELVEEVGGAEAFAQAVEQAGLSEDQVQAEVRTILVRELVAEELASQVAIDDAEVEQAFEEQRDTRFDTARARHILVESEEEAQSVLDRLEAGEDFAELAQEVSVDTGSAEQGGDLGEFSRGRMVAEFEEAVFAAEPGELLGPVETQFGFHIIEVLERSQPELAEVEEELRTELVAEREETLLQDWLQARREEAEVEVNPRFGTWDPAQGQVVPSDQLDGGEDPAATEGDPAAPEDEPTAPAEP